jgi:hypothetical protein
MAGGGMPGSPRNPVSPTLIVWGNVGVDPPDQTGSMGFDAVITEGHDRTAMVTEHTVEQGSAVVDHVRPNPQTLTLEVFISNVPITAGADRDFLPYTLDLGTPGDGSFFEGGTGALIQAGLQALGFSKGTPTQATVTVLQFTEEIDYVRSGLELLTNLLNTATLLQVFTPRANYENMVLSGVRLHRDKNTGTSGFFTLDFKQIRIVSSKIVAAPLPSIVRATPPVNKAKKDTVVADGPRDSLLSKAVTDGGATFNKVIGAFVP